MQRIDNDGLRQEIAEFNEGTMQEWLKNPDTQSVEVFEGTEENIEARKKSTGKPFGHKLSRGFKKARKTKRKRNQ